MAFDFALSDRVLAWRDRIRAFVDETVIPAEQQSFADGVTDSLRLRLQHAARGAGIWAPQAKADLGGGGFRFDEVAVLLEEAGTSLLGPMALNCAAPDEGNIHLLDAVCTPAQRARYLEPLVRGDVRSCFAMTEPAPGAGSDPQSLMTTASRATGGWVVNGTKHFITGADGAGFAIVMARDSESGSATMLIVDAGNPGMNVGAHARTLDSTMVGGHCRIEFEDAYVPDSAVLGAVGEGFRFAQVRLAPARLTHCMRWLGAARRAHELAVQRAVGRPMFDARLADLGMAQSMIADNEIELAAARALLWRTCWDIAEGARGSQESSRAKVFVSEVTGRVVDRAVQLMGGLGTTDEHVVGRIYAEIRAFRIYDGASEVHRMSIAKHAVRRMSSPPRVEGRAVGVTANS